MADRDVTIRLDIHDLAEEIGRNHLDYAEISNQMDYSKLAGEFNVSDIADHIDMSDIVFQVVNHIKSILRSWLRN